MDYSIIAPWKAEEKEQSEKLYKKLQGLMLLHPPTDDFRKCFNEEMFLKPNQQAFFQVMHYLFKLHDPIEFRKRFYWPMIDKKAEANFRSSTVEYLKYLNEKHQLRWNNIKSYLVVMPGGMKFINFLLDLVGFIVQEQIKQREKYLSTSNIEFSVHASNIKRMQMQNTLLKNFASKFIEELSIHAIKLQDKTKVIKSYLTELATSMDCNLNETLVLDSKFFQAFESDNQKLFEQNYNTPIDNIFHVEQLLANLKEAMDLFQYKEAELKINKDAVRDSLLKIKELFPKEIALEDGELDFQAVPYQSSIRINSLISAFNCIFPIIEEQLTRAEQMPRCSDFVIKELARLKSELQIIELQLTDFQRKVNIKMKKYNSEKNQPPQTPAHPINENLMSSNALLSKIVATPPIKLEILDSNVKRLPFLDDCHFNAERSIIASAKAGVENFNNLLAIPRSHRKQNTPEKFNSTLQKSKIIDPMELLRTIQKDASKSKLSQQSKLSTLGNNWKERQAIFGNDIAQPIPTVALNEKNLFDDREFLVNSSHCEDELLNGTSNNNKTLTSVSPFSPFNSNDLTRVARPHLLETSSNASGAATNSLFQKKLSAVKKVQDASLNLNLSSSPSGRLESLINMDANVLPVPKVLLNDVTINTEIGGDDKLEEDNKESNPFNNSLQNEIFDISDGVLRDVTM